MRFLRDRFERIRARWRGDEALQRRVYIGCTLAALVLSALVLAVIAKGEFDDAEALSDAPSPVLISSAPDEGETLPLGGQDGRPMGEAVSFELELDDGEASGILALALRGKIETESVEAKFSAPDTLTVSAAATRDALRGFLEREQTGVPAALTALLPETLSVELSLGVAADGSGGVSLEPRSFSANGVELTKYLPASLVSLAGEALNSAIPDSTPIKSVEVRDGSAVFLLDL